MRKLSDVIGNLVFVYVSPLVFIIKLLVLFLYFLNFCFVCVLHVWKDKWFSLPANSTRPVNTFFTRHFIINFAYERRDDRNQQHETITKQITNGRRTKRQTKRQTHERRTRRRTKRNRRRILILHTRNLTEIVCVRNNIIENKY